MLGEEGAQAEAAIQVKHRENGSEPQAGKEILTFISSIFHSNKQHWQQHRPSLVLEKSL